MTSDPRCGPFRRQLRKLKQPAGPSPATKFSRLACMLGALALAGYVVQPRAARFEPLIEGLRGGLRGSSVTEAPATAAAARRLTEGCTALEAYGKPNAKYLSETMPGGEPQRDRTCDAPSVVFSAGASFAPEAATTAHVCTPGLGYVNATGFAEAGCCESELWHATRGFFIFLYVMIGLICCCWPCLSCLICCCFGAMIAASNEADSAV